MKSKLQLETQFVKEKQWVPTAHDDALRILKEEVGDADPQGVFDYVLSTTQKGKVITVGSCRFRQIVKDEELSQ